jgi:Ca-activated chloride channel family protein
VTRHLARSVTRSATQPAIRPAIRPGARFAARLRTWFPARLATLLVFLVGLGATVVVFAPSGAETRTGAIAGTVRDTAGGPLAGASVFVPTTPLAAMSGIDGSFRIDGLAAGSCTLDVRLAGYRPARVTDLRVIPGTTVQTEVHLERDAAGVASPNTAPVGVNESAKARANTETRRGGSETLGDLLSPAPHMKDAPAVSGEGDMSAGLRELRMSIMPSPSAPGRAARPGAPPPMVPTTGGSRLPNDDAFDSMFFRHYGVNPFVPVDEDSLSTFALDVDAASYTLARRYLELGQLPDPAAVRVEEFVNYLPQGYPDFEDEDFRIFLEGAPSPFGPGYQLVRVGLKARTVSERARPPLDLTFVIDGSGSMAREDRLGLVQASLRMLVDKLRDGDRVGIVLFQTDAQVVLEPVILGNHPRMECEDGDHHSGWSPFDKHHDDRCRHGWSPSGRQRVLEAIDRLVAGGSTNAEAGLLLGYDMARRSFRSAASNRVILCSDGVANEGRTGAESILARVRSEADRGIRLTAVGCGMGNYNDILLEQLADRGDGNYFYVDDLSEARRVLVDGLTGTLLTVAQDAKVQVAFDPARVLRYRLLGFENRDVADRDFRNDRVDAGEVGPGHEVTALYEVKLAPDAPEGRLATVQVRYARPREQVGGRREVREITAVLDSRRLCRRFASASPLFRLDAAAAEFAEILRGSYWAKESRPADVIPVARLAAEDLRHASWGGVDPRVAEAAAELVTMLEQASRLEGQLSRNEEE